MPLLRLSIPLSTSIAAASQPIRSIHRHQASSIVPAPCTRGRGSDISMRASSAPLAGIPHAHGIVALDKNPPSAAARRTRAIPSSCHHHIPASDSTKASAAAAAHTWTSIAQTPAACTASGVFHSAGFPLCAERTRPLCPSPVPLLPPSPRLFIMDITAATLAVALYVWSSHAVVN
ncbi:hypothetical protein HYPSUDRAFT_213084 [Hypholoma sublateritium FD-334 SS-4]|uniref:Uncharacterized protein n=1 Tax=Hypholoma sublateritium (strain FD-334 SS-4) TaxID=945553 RepID=A0A0D2MR29_HYPSF|nr:hypothetical protein HYPSUDRAFT_213084 [Hypholoma sublateritium FD-334 SS-4]